MTINDRVKHLRKDILKINQEDFSAKINISRSNLGNIETNRVNTTDRVLADISENFNVNPEWLKTGEGEIFFQNETLEQLSNKYNLDAEELDLVKNYVSMTDEEKKAVTAFIQYLKSQRDQ